MNQSEKNNSLSASLRQWWEALKDFLYGFFVYGMIQEVIGRRRKRERIFFVLVVGDLLGVPMFPGYYRFRLLPYCLPRLDPWRRHMLGPKDLFTTLED
jgi:hypothetical protein